MGHSRPKYNSAVSTFCWAVANDEEFTVNDPSVELEVLYIDQALKELLSVLLDIIKNKKKPSMMKMVFLIMKD